MAITSPHPPPRDITPEESIVVDEKHNRQDHADTSHLETLEHSHTNQTELTNYSKGEDLEKVETFDIDPTNRLALKGDASDGKVDWTTKQIIATISLAMIYTGSQIPLYFTGGSLSFIEASIGPGSQISWLPVSNTLAIAAICPFVGYISDLFGRRNITIGGCFSIMVGIILMATAHSFAPAVVGMTLAGIGAGICELTAIAGTSELVPVNKRGFYLGVVTLFVLPFTPYVMYAQLLAHSKATWRWGFWICLIYDAIATLGIICTYFPVPHHKLHGKSKMDILRAIDLGGALLSIAGLTLFLVALQAGGYSHPWKSAYVICTLILGLLLIFAFIVWEAKIAAHPMVPHALFEGQNVVAMTFVIAFVGGMNFYSLLNFFPLSFTTIYSPAPVSVGLLALGPAIGTTVGASLGNTLVAWTHGRAREILLVSCILMTAFTGALAACTPATRGMYAAFGTIAGFGVGGVLVPTGAIALICTPDALIASVVALGLSIRVVGGSIGNAIYFNVFHQKINAKLPAYLVEYSLKAGLPATSLIPFLGAVAKGDLETAATVKGVTPAVLQAVVWGSRWAYADSLKYVWLVSIAFGAIAIVCSLFVANIKRFMTNRIATNIH